jgi:pimeloyl-ACP methyl ester carboxylesterase
MPNPILIVHGYSDGPESFQKLAKYLSNFGYQAEDVCYINYASLDDQANFEDFSDKLDEVIEKKYGSRPIDVICHSTGSLVVRAWLVLQRSRQLEKGITNPRSPIRRLICFAPANFGSDLAQMGQSFLQKFRATLFNHNVRPGESFQSGKLVLQALEPASPFQWALSSQDLFGNSYFAAEVNSFDKLCLPFIFAAGNYLTGIEADLVKNLCKAGTDSTVRICGTSLDVRKCSVNFFGKQTQPAWTPEVKFDRIPFCVFNGFSHCTIVDPTQKGFADADLGPAALLKLALGVDTEAAYAEAVSIFDKTSSANYATIPGDMKDPYQQFFFKVVDDTGLPIDDYYIDFHVLDAQGNANLDLTKAFDDFLNADFHTHSVDASCRVMMINCQKLNAYAKMLTDAKAKLVFTITARSPISDVSYEEGVCVVYDSQAAANPNDPSFLFPNTTTLVEITVVRRESDLLLNILDSNLEPVVLAAAPATPPAPTGRALLIQIASPDNKS